MKKMIVLGAAVVAAFVVSPLASADEPAPNLPHGVSGEPAGARSVCG